MARSTCNGQRLTTNAIVLQIGACRVRLRIARSFVARAIGLLATRRLAPDEGLLIAPCRAVHTFGMRFDIDAVFLDRAGKVLAVHPALAPWRAASCQSAFAVLELAAGAASRIGCEPGAVFAELGPWLKPPNRRSGREAT